MGTNLEDERVGEEEREREGGRGREKERVGEEEREKRMSEREKKRDFLSMIVQLTNNEQSTLVERMRELSQRERERISREGERGVKYK